MRDLRITRGFALLPLTLLALLALPAPAAPAAPASASTVSFLKSQVLYPSGGAGEVGPANHFPSSITVPSYDGTVIKATVTVLASGFSNPDDTDMVIAGPNGQKVMLMSDACGISSVDDVDWTFDDSAPTYMSDNGPCQGFQEATFKPSNYLGGSPEPDDLSTAGGPAPPYVNALSFFNGAPPGGTWSLYLLDDSAGAGAGFGLVGWALNLTIQPPPPVLTGPAPKKCKKKAKRASVAKKKCRKKHR
jgi:hypothetical protein